MRELPAIIEAFRKGYEAAVGERGARIAGGDREMIDGLEREVDAQFKRLGTAMGYAVDKLDEKEAANA